MMRWVFLFLMISISAVEAADSSAETSSSIDVIQLLSNINKNPFESKLPPPPAPVEVNISHENNQTNSTGSSIGSMVSNAVTKVIEPVKPTLNVSGVVWSPEIRQAIINGEIVSEGDVLNNAKIKAINRDGVRVLSQGREYLFTTP